MGNKQLKVKNKMQTSIKKEINVEKQASKQSNNNINEDFIRTYMSKFY
jgi:hypothetical protein